MVYGIHNGHYSIFHDNAERSQWLKLFPDAKPALAKNAWQNRRDLWLPKYDESGVMLGMWKVSKDPVTGKMTDYSLASPSYLQIMRESIN